MILVLGGTTEAVRIVNSFKKKGLPVYYSKATTYPQKIDADNEKMLTKSELKKLVETKNIRLIIDSTHPFAQKIKVVAKKVCAEKNITYLRYERPPVKISFKNCYQVTDFAAAAHQAVSLGKRVLILSGVNSIKPILEAVGTKKVHFFARVLDWPPSICKAESLLGHGHVISGRGPFSRQQNIDVIEKFKAEVIITKESGHLGGLKAKIAAAQKKNIPLVIVKRPVAKGPVIFNLKTLLAKVEEVLSG